MLMYEIFIRFFVLGLMSFGGPIAHIGYFQREFVEKRRWITHQEFSDALSLCQFLPGPASSQLGMYIGYQKGGALGAILAFIGFTFPSFLVLTLAASYQNILDHASVINLIIDAAKLLAVVVVFDAILQMIKKFIFDGKTVFFAVVSMSWVLLGGDVWRQMIPIIIAALFGAMFLQKKTDLADDTKLPESRINKQTLMLGGIFTLGLVVPLLSDHRILEIFGAFYQAGSFVFGGGHVVLPMLEPLVGEFVRPDVLVEGYAAAQLVPGPMFTMASFVGASIPDISPWLGSLIATVGIFLPGALLLFAALPNWQKWMHQPRFAGALILVNASVVGLLQAAFFQPVWQTAIGSYFDVCVVIGGWFLLSRFQWSIFRLMIFFFAYQFVFHTV